MLNKPDLRKRGVFMDLPRRKLHWYILILDNNENIQSFNSIGEEQYGYKRSGI